MQLKALLLTVTFIGSSSRALAIEITVFEGSGCVGPSGGTATGLTTGECLTLGSNAAKSVSYKDVPNQIQFFISGGAHDMCSNGASAIFYDGSGCATAPDGNSWESFGIF